MFTKKRYAGYKYEFDPANYVYLDKMGIILKRRDNAPYVNEVYGGPLKILFDWEPKTETKDECIGNAVKYTKQKVQDLLDGNVPIESLIISQSLSHSYKSKKLEEDVTIDILLAPPDPLRDSCRSHTCKECYSRYKLCIFFLF